MTPTDNEQANAALLFELDEKIEERIRGAIYRLLKVASNPHHDGLRTDLKFMVGNDLMSDDQFMKALCEEVFRHAHRQFNPNQPYYTSRFNLF